MLISEELFLLLTTGRGTPEPWVPHQNIVLGGALLTDLAVGGHITLDEEKNPRARLAHEIADANGSSAHPVIRFGIEALASRPTYRATHLVSASWFNPRTVIGRQLAQQGITDAVREFGIERYPTRDGAPRTALQNRLTEALTATAKPALNDVVLLTLLQQINGITRAVPEPTSTMSRADLCARIHAINKTANQNNSRITEAVGSAIRALQAVLAGAASTAVL